MRLGLLLLPLVSGCGCAGTDSDGGADADADTDVDSDVDTDVDTDSDTDSGTGTGTDTGTDSGTDTGPCDGPDEWVMDDAAIGDETVGFDLDDHETVDRSDPVGCGKVDGEGGIDNQLGPLLEAMAGILGDFDANTIIAEAIADGSMLLLVRTLDLDDPVVDDALDAHVFFGMDADGDLGNNFGGCGEFLIDPTSLESPPDEATARARFEDASVAAARFAGGPADLPLRIPFGPDTTLDAVAHDARIEWTFGAVSRDDLSDGVIGGHVLLTDVIRALVGGGAVDPEFEGLMTSVLAGQADIDAIAPGPTGVVCVSDDDCGVGQVCETSECEEPPDMCDSISLGMTFTAVPAEITGVAE